MTWLKKVTSAILKYLPIILGTGGLIQTVLPAGAAGTAAKVLGDMNGIPQLVVTAEAMFAAPGSGSQKLAAIAPLVQQIITQYVEAQEPGSAKIHDPAKLATASAQIVSGFADALNSFGA